MLRFADYVLFRPLVADDATCYVDAVQGSLATFGPWMPWGHGYCNLGYWVRASRQRPPGRRARGRHRAQPARMGERLAAAHVLSLVPPR